jgi:hypothetical protein
MKINDCPKSNRLQTHTRRTNSGGYCVSMTQPGFHPAHGFLICLGWLRLYQTILCKRSRNRRAKV